MTMCMKCQILFSRKNEKKKISLSLADFAHSVENVCLPQILFLAFKKHLGKFLTDNILKLILFYFRQNKT